MPIFHGTADYRQWQHLTFKANPFPKFVFHAFNCQYNSIFSCAESNLNGIYRDSPTGEDSRNYKGIFWEHWLGDYSLKASKMMIRPKENSFSEPPDDDLIELGDKTTEQ